MFLIENIMLIVDLYSLLPAFTLASLLVILLWPEDIAFKGRLRLFMAILVVWIVASIFGMAGYGTSEKPTACFINLVVGILGLIALLATYWTKPERHNHSAQNPPRSNQ